MNIFYNQSGIKYFVPLCIDYKILKLKDFDPTCRLCSILSQLCPIVELFR